ncbi:hypothetical protein NMY22_g13013 [Coprinellus aureogranulatus]|nr:hypothetical protein NMY22_g13013 [Coprinellus aureogranulatus]
MGGEKWVVKSLSDEALQLVLDLHNYEVMNSRFPGNIKDMWLTSFHKKGLHTQLANWRGITISNFLANSPMTWLNNCLIKYASEKAILPDTQVAAQPGVQTRDIMGFLAGVKCWAKRHGETVYAVKRDQMKGFDYLSPQGFYDAIVAYGLPLSIIELDKAAQTETKCFIRTAYGYTDGLTVSGVTKQGGPLSPLKSTLTTSLGHRYLDDLTKTDPDSLVITTKLHKTGDPHREEDNLRLTVAMVEATDDSYLLSRTLEGLRRETLEMERFQYAYGWLTSWQKTSAYVLNPKTEHPPRIKMPSVTLAEGQDYRTITEHEIPLIQDELDFLRTSVDDPKSRFHELKDFIEAFQFPYSINRLPLTLVRKIVAQKVVSACRAKMYLQPLKPQDANALDRAIITKVHALVGFPYAPSTEIATLPVEARGFGFPSLARINAGMAVDGLLRDLNHHIPAYRTMARITLAEWTCEKHNCVDPLGESGMRSDFSRQFKQIPSTWLIAHATMRRMEPPLLVRKTDQSALALGDVSLSHVLNVVSHRIPQMEVKKKISGPSMKSLRTRGIKKLNDVGEWVRSAAGEVTMRFKSRSFERAQWSKAAEQNWFKLGEILGNITLDQLTDGDAELLIPRSTRRQKAERGPRMDP